MRLGLPSDRTLVDAEQLVGRLRNDATATTVVGACGGATALVVRRILAASGRPVVAITSTADKAHALAADLRFVLGPECSPQLFDASEQSPYAHAVSDRRAAQRRLATLFALSALAADGTDEPPVIVLPAAALARKVVPAADVRARSLALEVAAEIDRDQFARELDASGYLRVPLVEDPGTFSIRGALVDVWAPGQRDPVRIELDGDLIERIRAFDPDDQRSKGELDELMLPPAREAPQDRESLERARRAVRDLCDAVDYPSTKTRNLIDDLLAGRAFFGADGFLPAFCNLEPLSTQLPSHAVVVVEEPRAVADALTAELERAESDVLEKHGEPAFEPDAFFVDRADVDAWLTTMTRLGLCESPILGGEHGALEALGVVDDDTPSLGARDQTELRRKLAAARAEGGHAASLDPLVESVRDMQQQGLRVVFTARATTQADRLATMLRHRDLEVEVLGDDFDRAATLAPPRGMPPVVIAVGSLERGLVAPAEGLALITEEEVFGARAHRRRAKQPGKKRTKQLLEDLRSLAIGDHVVHIDHGVGRYEGLLHRAVAGHTVDLLVVSYAGGDKLYVPVYRLNQVHKFKGGDAEPKLDRLGGQSFARAKSRAKKKVRRIADKLLALYAQRAAAVGEPTPPVDDEYRAFEATFPFEETADQARAIEDVNGDLELARPMDRLVCGDVGFGKTEVALRAAFRVAMSGRQVAVLCPTTVLAQQHKMTFDTRLSGYPVTVAVLSRFRTKREQDETVRGLRDGKVDLVIGTHRLLSKDVHFRDLGLLVVDEEQRFGVTAKERIKSLKTNVDVLTLSATPIPRTLQMSITGLRDLSIIATPPADRRSVRTIVTRQDPTVLRDAMLRELSRGGQIFYVYNRIGGLEERAAMVQDLVPQARVAMVHGQLSERRLEKTMIDFVEGSYDVLVTTAIIENGLDIPRANTIVVDRADLFGLAQLYQLRGRVGRSRERGYCYLVLPTGGSVSDDARTRMEAMQRYSELGSGFQVASLDLDLRGAGDVVGADQTGASTEVGFEMFCSMLEEAAAEARGETVVPAIDPELSFDVEALLPDAYVPDVGVRLSLYKRLAEAADEHEVRQLSEEMEDRFGQPPPAARRYVHLMRLKTELRTLRVLGCEASAKAVTLHLRDDTPIDPSRLLPMLGKGKLPLKLTPDMRLVRRVRAGEIYANGLAHCDKLLAELNDRMQ
jgi:transcription-repair coupling factor (superfamily II helicase)